MGLDIFRSKGHEHVAGHAHNLAECLQKYGAYYDSEPVLRVSKQALMDAMKDAEFGEAIAEAFRADLEEVTYHLWY
jgi:hypothetical protein